MPRLKSGQAINGQWTTVNDLGSASASQGIQSQNTQGRLNSAARSLRLDFGADLYPFKIYSFPSVWRAAPAPATDWLKIRVVAGYYNNVIVSGCDRADALPGTSLYIPGGPDAQTIPSEAGSDFTGQEYVIPSGQTQIFFWIDASTPTAPAIKWGYAGSSASGLGGTPTSQGWTAFPNPDAQHIPIGWIDTSSDAATYTPHIRQLLRSDNPSAGGASSNVAPYTFVSDGGTYWACTNSSGEPVNLAKPYKLRTSLASETIAGTVYSYAYTLVNGIYQRTVTYSGFTEVQQLVPPPVPGDTLYGISSTNIPVGTAPLSVASAALASGGSGYLVGDLLSLNSGTVLTHAATILVTGVNSGAITTYTLQSGGSYTVEPTLTAGPTIGGTGTGATFTVTMNEGVLDLNLDARAWSET